MEGEGQISWEWWFCLSIEIASIL